MCSSVISRVNSSTNLLVCDVCVTYDLQYMYKCIEYNYIVVDFKTIHIPLRSVQGKKMTDFNFCISDEINGNLFLLEETGSAR